MKKKVLSACLCMFFLCACTATAGGIEDLMKAPSLNQQQREVYDALESTINLKDIIYKYPQNGEYRSSFVFYDLDGDGRQEAVVFYAFASESDSVRVKVLRQEPQGGWSSVYDVSVHDAGFNANQIDFVQFANILSKERACMLIGWETDRSNHMLGVYSYDGTVFRREMLQPYSLYTVEDFSGNGLMDIACAYPDNEQFYLGLYQAGDGFIAELDELELSPDASVMRQMITGRLWNGKKALYIDEGIRDGAATATEVVRVADGRLELVAGESEDESIMYNYVETHREEEILCSDLDGDGVVEVPRYVPMAGQSESDEIQSLYLTQLMRLSEDGFHIASTAAINEADGYLLYFPEEWVGNVTVVRQTETSEWRFYVYDHNTEQTGVELLRIRRYSTNDYQDQFIQDYTLVEEKGVFQYYAYFPNAANSLSINEKQLERLFVLL